MLLFNGNITLKNNNFMVDVIIGIIIIMCVESKLRLYTDNGTGDVININGLVHLCKTDKWQRRI